MKNTADDMRYLGFALIFFWPCHFVARSMIPTGTAAYRTLQEAIGERPKTVPGEAKAEKNPAAVRRGRKGGKKGGKARVESLTERQLRALARKAAKRRWKETGSA